MQARHAGPSCIGASWIQCATMFFVDHGVEQAMQFRLEHGLESTQHEIPSRSRVDEESQV